MIYEMDVQNIDAILNSGDFWMQGFIVEIVISPEFQAYDEFRSLGPKAEHMAWSMETSTEHTVTITSEEMFPSNAKTTPSGADYTITLSSNLLKEMNIIQKNEKGLIMYDQVGNYILNTQADYNYMSAIWDQTVGEILSLNGKVNLAAVMLQYVWDTTTSNFIMAIGGAIASTVPGYDFFNNLKNQQDYYDICMRLSRIAYPFRDS